MIFNYTTLDTVIEKINRVPIFKNNFNPEELKEWSVEALLKIGVNESKAPINKEIEIKDGKGKLPLNLEYLDTVLEGESGYPMDLINPRDDYRELTYKINSGYIFTDFEVGSVVLNYYGLLLDEFNKPLIPDNIYFLSAIEAYFKFKIGDKLYWMNKIVQGQRNMLEQDWLYYCNSAKNASKELNEDGRQNFKKTRLTMFPELNKRKKKSTPSIEYDIVNRTTLKA